MDSRVLYAEDCQSITKMRSESNVDHIIEVWVWLAWAAYAADTWISAQCATEAAGVNRQSPTWARLQWFTLWHQTSDQKVSCTIYKHFWSTVFAHVIWYSIWFQCDQFRSHPSAMCLNTCGPKCTVHPSIIVRQQSTYNPKLTLTLLLLTDGASFSEYWAT